MKSILGLRSSSFAGVGQQSKATAIITEPRTINRCIIPLVYLKECFEYKIVRYDDELLIEKSGSIISMKQDDVSVYGKILQLTSYRDFAYQTTGVSIGELCSFPVRKRNDGCECARASKSIKRLQHVNLCHLKLF